MGSPTVLNDTYLLDEIGRKEYLSGKGPCENCVEISKISVYVLFVSRHVLDADFVSVRIGRIHPESHLPVIL